MRSVSLLILLALCPTASAQKPITKYQDKDLEYWITRFRTVENEKDRILAEQAVIAFGRNAAPASGVLLEMLDDGSESYRHSVANMLCAIGPGAKEGVPGLIKLLEEKSPRDPHEVIRVLCAIGPDAKDSIPVIRRVVLKYVAAGEKRASLWNFGNGGPHLYDFDNLGPEAVPMLLDFIEAPKSQPSLAVANGFESLQQLGSSGKTAAPRLVKLLKHDEPAFRLQAARTLWAVDNNPAAITALIELVKGDNERLGEQAVEALGDIGTAAKSALPMLKSFVPKEDRSTPVGVVPVAPAYYPTRAGGIQQAARDAIRKIEPQK